MSSEQSTESMAQRARQRNASLMERLEYVYQQYQQQHLYNRLDEIAAQMEETLLQVAIARELFDAELSVSAEAKREVKEMQATLEESSDEGEVTESPMDEAQLDDVEQIVDDEADRIETRIHELRAQQASTVTAIQKLNDEFNLIDSTGLAKLSTLLDNWEWDARLEDADDFESKLGAALEFAQEMRQVLDEAREEIGAGFEGDMIEELADTLLSGESLSLDDLDSAERDALAESKLGKYLTVSLG